MSLYFDVHATICSRQVCRDEATTYDPGAQLASAMAGAHDLCALTWWPCGRAQMFSLFRQEPAVKDKKKKKKDKKKTEESESEDLAPVAWPQVIFSSEVVSS